MISIFIIISFSIVAYQPAEVVIIGPRFHEQDYFVEELNLIAEELSIVIKYEAISDPETFIIDNPDNSGSIAIIPNPQGVVNLAEKELIFNLNNIYVDEHSISTLYSNHLTSIVSHEGSIYAGWFRLFPNSLIWYDISKFELNNIYAGSKPNSWSFKDFDTLIQNTKQIADTGISPWCLHSESAASSGWIQTNWLEDILLTKYGTKVYDKWSNLQISASSIEVFKSISLIGDIVFYPNHLQGGYRSVNDKEFSTLPSFLLNDENDCFLSWGGHYFRYYIPEEYVYLEDYAVAPLPKINFDNSIVGIGDNIVLINNNELSRKVISKILSKDFGETWSIYKDSHYISANKNFNKNKIINKLTLYEYSIVHNALDKDLFRYDASELMDRPIGADILLKFFVEYLYSGNNTLVSLLNNLDKEF